MQRYKLLLKQPNFLTLFKNFIFPTNPTSTEELEDAPVLISLKLKTFFFPVQRQEVFLHFPNFFHTFPTQLESHHLTGVNLIEIIFAKDIRWTSLTFSTENLNPDDCHHLTELISTELTNRTNSLKCRMVAHQIIGQ